MEEDMVSHRPKPDDELALNLYNNTMTGDWKKIVEMYNEHKFSAIDARINPSGDTVLHVAVAIAPEHIVKELVRVISQTSEMSLWIKNNDGNTPLHVAASTGRFIICIILAKVLDELSDFSDELQKLFRNEAGESPLFLAAFHGHKPSFLYLHLLLLEAYDTDMERSNPIYRRNDGETALHCAIRWEYFGIYVEELKHETVREELIDSVIKELDESSEIKDNNFPETYQTCIHFYQPLQTMSQFGMK
ncbi:hypothetical protein CFP56_004022 [Quercus suber]|uniref:Uncharacterized protein n=1 Tax=Quercus suber TaxID=58331 RepID=A0AAW0IIJ8_QUESU